jgi:hypothetical protein
VLLPILHRLLLLRLQSLLCWLLLLWLQLEEEEVYGTTRVDFQHLHASICTS